MSHKEMYRGWNIEEVKGKVYAKCEGTTYGPYATVADAKAAIYTPMPKV